MRIDFFTRMLLLVCVFACSTAHAQQYDFPGLNTLGRFLGYGYSQQGYQSPSDGRFNALARRHPPAEYASHRLSYPYSPYYRPAAQARPQLPAVRLVRPGPDGTPANPNVSAKPIVPTQPVEPPPQWLEPYLDNGRGATNEGKPSESSRAAPFYFEPQEQRDTSESDLLPSPSDREVDDESLLHDDDDALLLESDDLSSRRKSLGPTINRSSPPSPLNRYKQAMTRSTQR